MSKIEIDLSFLHELRSRGIVTDDRYDELYVQAVAALTAAKPGIAPEDTACAEQMFLQEIRLLDQQWLARSPAYQVRRGWGKARQFPTGGRLVLLILRCALLSLVSMCGGLGVLAMTSFGTDLTWLEETSGSVLLALGVPLLALCWSAYWARLHFTKYRQYRQGLADYESRRSVLLNHFWNSLRKRDVADRSVDAFGTASISLTTDTNFSQAKPGSV